MGTRHFCIPGFLRSLSILQTRQTCVYLDMCHIAVASMHENHKANTTDTKEETKNASTIVNVEGNLVDVNCVFPFPFLFLFCSFFRMLI